MTLSEIFKVVVLWHEIVKLLSTGYSKIIFPFHLTRKKIKSGNGEYIKETTPQTISVISLLHFKVTGYQMTLLQVFIKNVANKKL